MNNALIKRLRKIATLEAEDYGAEPQDHSSWKAADLIERQAAQIEMMRDGLKRADDLLRTSYDHVSPLIREALSTTPDQALEPFAARVREQCEVRIDVLKTLYLTQSRPAYEEALLIAACDDSLSAIRAIKEFT